MIVLLLAPMPAGARPGWLEVGGVSRGRPAPRLAPRSAYGFFDQLVLRWAKVRTRKTLSLPKLGKTKIGRCQTTSEKSSRVERISRGFCGTRRAGYRWVERTDLESSIVPVVVRADLYGVSGLRAEWRFSLAHAGQAGHASFRHGALRVRFASRAARARFVRAWQRYFGRAPTFTPAKRSRPRR